MRLECDEHVLAALWPDAEHSLSPITQSIDPRAS